MQALRTTPTGLQHGRSEGCHLRRQPDEVSRNTLKLVGIAGSAGSLKGRACASAPELLKQLEINQERSGDTLIVHLRNTQDIKFSLFGMGRRYAYLPRKT